MSRSPSLIIAPIVLLACPLLSADDSRGIRLGQQSTSQWRFGVVPIGTDELAFGFLSSVATGKLNHTTGKYEFDSTGSAAPEGGYSWYAGI